MIDQFSELERDALTELVNIGVSRASVSLRNMLNQPVKLSAPALEVISREEAATLLIDREAGALVGVRQDFGGAFSGRALLIFPQSSSTELVQNLAGMELSEADLAELENDALGETGNILIHSCLGSMANMLEGNLSLTAPNVVRGNGHALLEASEANAAAVVLVLYINFAVDQRSIRGYLALLIDMASLGSLRQLVGEFIAKVLGPV